MDKLVRNAPSAGGAPAANHAFPTLSVPEDRIVGEKEGAGTFQRIQFHADGARKGSGREGEDGPEAVAAKMRTAAKQAYDDGFADGKTAGAEEARKEMETVLHQFRRAFIEVEKFRRELYLNAEAVAVELAMAVARKVVQVEIGTNPDVVAAVTREALTRIVDQERISIHVNPADMPRIEQALGDFSGVVKSIEAVSFEPDGAVAPGGCLIVTNFGEIDAGIDTQLDTIASRLGDEFDRSRVQR